MGSDEYPEGLLYDGEYTWVRVEGDIAYLGVTKPAASRVDEFVFIKLPERNKVIRKGETYVTLEAVKWSGHLPSPVTGDVVDTNGPLFEDPSLINRKPYDSWIVKLRLHDKSETGSLYGASDAILRGRRQHGK